MEPSRPEFIVLEEFSKLLREVAELRLENERLKEESYVRYSGLEPFVPVFEDKPSDTFISINKVAPEMYSVLCSVLDRLLILSESRIKENGSAWFGYAWYPESFDTCICDIRAVVEKVRGNK